MIWRKILKLNSWFYFISMESGGGQHFLNMIWLSTSTKRVTLGISWHLDLHFIKNVDLFFVNKYCFRLIWGRNSKVTDRYVSILKFIYYCVVLKYESPTLPARFSIYWNFSQCRQYFSLYFIQYFLKYKYCK